MNRIDKVITQAESEWLYIIDVLRAYREIVNTGSCNECASKLTCQYCPKAGEIVRYNCPHYQKQV